ncbi:MAG TPA: hypothetical protein VFR70_11440 [Flavobacterium sp.]|nr:hypothetical protein [Flavobacterium sp.]
MLEISVKSAEIIQAQTAETSREENLEIKSTADAQAVSAPVPAPEPEDRPEKNEITVSALSLSSIKAKRELEKANASIVRPEAELPKNDFTETDMLLQWNKYAQRLGDKGHKIMESLLLINNPKLKGTTIIHELPNEGSKIDFESGKHDLLGYLRGKLHNHDIQIEAVVNEAVENKFAFTPQDKFNRLKEINPALDVLRRTFDLDI